MKNAVIESLESLRDSTVYYAGQLMFGYYAKMVIAAVATFFTEVLYGDVNVFGIYILFASADLVLGVLKSRVYGTFDPKYLFHWMRKFLTYMALVVITGLLCHAFFRTSGVIIYAVNWGLFCCCLTEAASIINNLRSLGCPIHPVLEKIMGVLRRRVAAHISVELNDPEVRRHVEAALNGKVPPCPK